MGTRAVEAAGPERRVEFCSLEAEGQEGEKTGLVAIPGTRHVWLGFHPELTWQVEP
jgi:hypothetical protein